MSESALNFGGGTSVRLILFFNSSHRHTRTASSYCKLHFPRETAASPKAKQNVITQEFEKYQKVWVLLQKSSVSTNKCGAQTCFIIEMADGPITAVRRDCGKQSVHSDHDPSFLLLQQGDRVWSWNPQNSNRTHYCCSSKRRTDRPIHSFKSGMFIHFIIIVVFLSGNKPRSYWPERGKILGNNWVKCNICTEINSKQIGNDLQSKHARKCLSLGSLCNFWSSTDLIVTHNLNHTHQIVFSSLAIQRKCCTEVNLPLRCLVFQTDHSNWILCLKFAVAGGAGCVVFILLGCTDCPSDHNKAKKKEEGWGYREFWETRDQCLNAFQSLLWL